MARVPFVFEEKEQKDMSIRISKLNWSVLMVLLLGLLSSLASATAADTANTVVAAEQKISIIPEPVTLLVLLASLTLFSWRRTRKGRSRPIATAKRT